MKIVNYETFVRMPAGTIFAPYEPCVALEDWEIKVDEPREYKRNGEKYWAYNGTMPLEPSFINPEEATDFGTYETEMFIYDGSNADILEYKMFAVFEPHEVERLIYALRWALEGCKNDSPYMGAVVK